MEYPRGLGVSSEGAEGGRDRERKAEAEQERGRAALRQAACCPICDSVVFALVPRTIMGPHGVSRAVQRLEFSDCRKGLGESWTPDGRETQSRGPLKLCVCVGQV